jgi:hypothetical protein
VHRRRDGRRGALRARVIRSGEPAPRSASHSRTKYAPWVPPAGRLEGHDAGETPAEERRDSGRS